MLKFHVLLAPFKNGLRLKLILNKKAIKQLAENLHLVDSGFNKSVFVTDALLDLEPLGIKDRCSQIATAVRNISQMLIRRLSKSFELNKSTKIWNKPIFKTAGSNP